MNPGDEPLVPIAPRDLLRAGLRGGLLGALPGLIAALGLGARAGLGVWTALGGAIGVAALVEGVLARRSVRARVLLTGLCTWVALGVGGVLAHRSAEADLGLVGLSPAALDRLPLELVQALFLGFPLALVTADRAAGLRYRGCVSLGGCALAGSASCLLFVADLVAKSARQEGWVAAAGLGFATLVLGTVVVTGMLLLPTTLCSGLLHLLERLEARLFPAPPEGGSERAG